jgi:hypothetical protein
VKNYTKFSIGNLKTGSLIGKIRTGNNSLFKEDENKVGGNVQNRKMEGIFLNKRGLNTKEKIRHKKLNRST